MAEEKFEFRHKSVLLRECIDNLNINPDGIYVDGTMGGAGHSFHIAGRLSDKGRLIAIDQDKDAIEAGQERLSTYGDRVTIVRSNYSFMKEIVRGMDIDGVDGILLDLGVSSYQLDNPQRGFTYREEDAPLDMRMDDRMAVTAKDIVNDYTENELRKIIKNYGEDKFAPQIARAIVRRRERHVIETAGELVDIIKSAYPAKELRKAGHPAKKTFQAIRIELNDELKVLEENLRDMIDILNDKGRICVITFHSLEDRIVKNIFRECENPCVCPSDFPVCVCGRLSKGKVISKKPILPDDEELEYNSRAQSAKLRVFERIV
ncbi:MAG: 16S rRNA (cytosine(1402)-N(4))-methyltransferase RsmH [Lachnospiraceae bacterium]|nr:16S rRNA (cytosine(1402)-N(4))-methyltransferase RsmH [Lachnospiraceae bacterium]